MSGTAEADPAHRVAPEFARARDRLQLDKWYVARMQWRRLLGAIDAIDVQADARPGSSHAQVMRDGAATYIVKRFCWIYQKAFIYELNLHTGSKDDTASFDAFLDVCASEEFQRYIDGKYADLNTRVDVFLANITAFVREHETHWLADCSTLRELDFAPGHDPVSIQLAVGDPHLGARATIRYDFGNRQLFYKPRSMAPDLLFARAQHLLAPDMRVLKSLDCGDHGWQVGIRAAKPEGKAAAKRFYRDTGSALAVLHLLLGTDIHFENIASDEDGAPYFIDVEALFTNQARSGRINADPTPRTSAEHAFEKQIAESIFSIGIVPFMQSGDGQFAGVAQVNKMTAPVARDIMVDARRGNMRFERASHEFDVDPAVPQDDGEPARAGGYIDQILAGYRAASSRAIEHAAELRVLLQAPVNARQILRNTYVYSLFLAESTHPLVASSRAGFDKLMAKLRHEERFKPYLGRTFVGEVEQLRAFDIPYFFAPASSTSLGSNGVEYPDFFDGSALDTCMARLDGYPAQILRQENFLRCAYRCVGETLLKPAETGESVATQVFDMLAGSALVGADERTVTWTFCPPENRVSGGVALTPFGLDLYSGIAGVFWFLSDYARSRDDAQADVLCAKARATCTQLAGYRLAHVSQGAMSGYNGMLWALAYDAVRSGDAIAADCWIDELCSPAHYARIESFDVVDGLAGCVLQLVGMFKLCGQSRLLEMAQLLVERTLAGAHGEEGQLYWAYKAMDRPLLGFGHGGAGIVCALAELSGARGTRDLDQQIMAALRYEDAYFRADLGLWPDLRQDTPSFTTSWCNGAAGHILARSRCYHLLSDEQRGSVNTAINRLAGYASSHEKDDSLCHGLIGMAECLGEYHQRVGGDANNALVLSALEKIRRRGRIRSGWSSDPGNLGLMVGCTGLGLAELRTRDASIPSPLTFQPAETSVAPQRGA